MVCPQCRSPFEPNHRGRPKVYCSKSCQEAAKHDRKVAEERVRRLERRADIVCLTCGAALAARRARRYCSVTCANRDSDRFHRRRELVKSSATTLAVSKAAIAKRDRWMCGLCGEPVDPLIKGPAAGAPSLDHIVPLSRGGAHSPDNARLAHLGCNRRKGSRTDEEAISDFPYLRHSWPATLGVLACAG